MARAIWTGALSFGLVNVPVGLFSATEDKAIRFNQFQAGTSDRVRNKRVNERTGEEVPYDEIVKGYDLGGGEYVVITPEELASVAPGASRTIDISDFVELGEIDPLYFDRSYYLAPVGKGSDRAYALLLEAMSTMGKVALGQFVMRDHQYLVAVRPHSDALVLETLRFGDEVRDVSTEVDGIPVEASFEKRELEMARLLIDSMATEWDPERYHDTYRVEVEELIEQKRSGATIVTEVKEAPPAPVVDLLAALEASVDAARGAGARRGAGSGSGSGSKAGSGSGSGSGRSGGGARGTGGRAAASTAKSAKSKVAAKPKRVVAAREPSRSSKTVAARRRNTTQTTRATPSETKARPSRRKAS